MAIGTKDLRYLLSESTYAVRKRRGPMDVATFAETLVEQKQWDRYISSFASTMDPQTAKEFKVLANNTRKELLRKMVLEQATMGNLGYYETLTFPILTVFYPRLIARQLVTVSPMNKPTVIKGFLKPKFRTYGSNTYVEGPVMDQDVSLGVQPQNGYVSVPTGSPYNLVQALGIDPNVATVQLLNNVDLVGVNINTGSSTITQNVYIKPSIDGLISGEFVDPNGNTVYITGALDQKSGNLMVMASNPEVVSVNVSYATSNELNLTSAKIEFDIEKIRLDAKDRQITANWSLQFEQDIRALYDIDLQAQLVAMIGEQIALDIDKEIVGKLIRIASYIPNHQQTFYTLPPTNFVFGPKEWYKTSVVQIDQLAAQIYADTNIGVGNIIAVNPVNVNILTAYDDFVFTHADNYADSNVGYQEATMTSGKYKVLVSPIVPQNQMLIIFNPKGNEAQSVYFYSPYIPAVVHPYPMMNVPTLSFLTRYAETVVRPHGIALLNLNTTTIAPTT